MHVEHQNIVTDCFLMHTLRHLSNYCYAKAIIFSADALLAQLNGLAMAYSTCCPFVCTGGDGITPNLFTDVFLSNVFLKGAMEMTIS